MIKNFHQFIFESRSDLILYHGSKNGISFEQFSKERILSGNGEITYGYGFYFTDDKKIANTYAGNGLIYTVKINSPKFLSYEKTATSEKQRITRLFYEYCLNTEFGKDAYPDNASKKDFYDFECKPILDCYDGLKIYGTICSVLGDDKEASEFLYSIGYTGLKYHDYDRIADYNNYVIFNEKNIEIILKENAN